MAQTGRAGRQPASYAAPVRGVSVTDHFFGRLRETVRTRMLPYQWEALNDRVPDAEPSHCLENFRIAAGLAKGEHGGFVFQDSDVYKWIEACAWSLAWHPDEALLSRVREAVDLIAAAQCPDGYLNTYYQLTAPEKRFTNLLNNHELYCVGHLLEAALALAEVTGEEKLLNTARRAVACVRRHIGPEEGKLHGYPGHEVLEMALCRLYEYAGDEEALSFAKYLLEERGKEPLFFEEERKRNGNRFYWEDSAFRYAYCQAHKPVKEQTDAAGHAVRAMYLYAGMAEEARLTGDEEMAAAAQRLWESVTRRQMYITGAVGASAYGESFTYDYDLPNGLVYGETCASVGLAFFAERMLRLHPRAEYADVLEKVLYNGAISGMSLSGTEFFYVNPLEAEPKRDALVEAFRHVKTRRQPWFSCACCPPNLARLLTSLGNYLWMTREDRLYVHLYAAAEGRVTAASGTARVAVRSGYPWDGRISVKTEMEEGEVTLALRVPGWCAAWEVSLDGHPVEASLEEGYLVLPALMTGEHEAVLDLAMPAKAMTADRRIRADHGKLAVQKGPIVFCLEEADNGPDLYELAMSPDAPFYVETCKGELAGMIRVRVPGYRVYDDVPKREAPALYHPAGALRREPFTLTFIPYCAWANREEGEMRVFVNRL